MGFKEFLNEFEIKALKSYIPNAIPAPITKTGRRGGAHLLKPYGVVNPARPFIRQQNHIFITNQTPKKSGIVGK